MDSQWPFIYVPCDLDYALKTVLVRNCEFQFIILISKLMRMRSWKQSYENSNERELINQYSIDRSTTCLDRDSQANGHDKTL
jgi:hypothetical protein